MNGFVKHKLSIYSDRLSEYARLAFKAPAAGEVIPPAPLVRPDTPFTLGRCATASLLSLSFAVAVIAVASNIYDREDDVAYEPYDDPTTIITDTECMPRDMPKLEELPPKPIVHAIVDYDL